MENEEIKKENSEAQGDIIDSSMLVGDIIAKHPLAAQFLIECGMGCIYCPASLYETIEQACLVHGIDPDDMVEELNTFLDSRA